MSQTHEAYYSNEDNYGKYQYVPLSEVIKKMTLLASDHRSHLSGTSRSTIIMHAKEGLRNLTSDIKQEQLAYEITVPDSLVWPLPQDYVSNLSIFLVHRDTKTGNFELLRLDKNNKMHTTTGYLQDHDAKLLYDHDGQILEADSSNAMAKPYKNTPNYPSYLGGRPTKDTSKYSQYGSYQFDKRKGIIVFSSDLADKEVVIKYISDGLQAQLSESEVSLHKYIREPLEDYIYYNCIAPLKNTIVPAIEKERARKKFKSSRHNAVMNLSNFDMVSISKVMNQATKIF